MISRDMLLDGLDLDPQARAAIAQRDARSAYDGPWYLQALSFLGAWIAALFLLVWVVLLTGFKAEGFVLWGLVVTGAAIGARPSLRTPFVAQMMLAACICGQLMLAFGFAEASRGFFVPAVGSAVVAAVVYVLYRDAGARFLSPFIPLGFALAAVFEHHGQEEGLHVVVLVEVVLVGLAYAAPTPWPALRPLGLSAVCSLAGTLLLLQYFQHVWPSTVVLTLALFAFHRRPTPLWVVVAVLGAISTPGVIFGIGLVTLGLARHDRLLGGLGGLFLTVFVSWFYYQLGIDLATKSWILIASGGVLLLVRSTLPRSPEAA